VGSICIISLAVSITAAVRLTGFSSVNASSFTKQLTILLVSIIFVKNVGVRNMRRNEIFVPEDLMNEALEAVCKVVPIKRKILYGKEYNC
jgi:hypothetical protein